MTNYSFFHVCFTSPLRLFHSLHIPHSRSCSAQTAGTAPGDPVAWCLWWVLRPLHHHLHHRTPAPQGRTWCNNSQAVPSSRSRVQIKRGAVAMSAAERTWRARLRSSRLCLRGGLWTLHCLCSRQATDDIRPMRVNGDIWLPQRQPWPRAPDVFLMHDHGDFILTHCWRRVPRSPDPMCVANSQTPMGTKLTLLTGQVYGAVWADLICWLKG